MAAPAAGRCAALRRRTGVVFICRGGASRGEDEQKDEALAAKRNLREHRSASPRLKRRSPRPAPLRWPESFLRHPIRKKSRGQEVDPRGRLHHPEEDSGHLHPPPRHQDVGGRLRARSARPSWPTARCARRGRAVRACRRAGACDTKRLGVSRGASGLKVHRKSRKIAWGFRRWFALDPACPDLA